jgi:hypothetical protein
MDTDGLEPPAELDRIVLTNAREAIRIRSSPPPFRFARWAVPFGLAATGVLSFAVMLHLGLLSPKATREVERIEARLHLEQPPQQASVEVAADSAAPAPAANSGATTAAAPAEQERSVKRAEADAAAAGTRASAQAKAAPAEKEEPQAWLKRIETLRAQGKAHEADRELDAFHKAWPDYPTSADRDR